jgi:hypothetical protein
MSAENPAEDALNKDAVTESQEKEKLILPTIDQPTNQN